MPLMSIFNKRPAHLNLETRKKISALELETWQKINQLEESLIGTDQYMGKGYFWASDYKHSLRDCTDLSRRKVHAAFIKAGLELHGVSAQHEEIVNRITNNDKRLIRCYGRFEKAV